MAPIPRPHKKSYFLQMVLIRNITIKNKLDQTESEIRELAEAEGNEMREDDYPRFGAVAALTGNSYLLSGGLVTRNKEQSITDNTWLFEVLSKEGSHSFKVTKKASMSVPRSGHALVVFHNEVYAIGGFNEKSGIINECERYSLSTNKK